MINMLSVRVGEILFIPYIYFNTETQESCMNSLLVCPGLMFNFPDKQIHCAAKTP